MGPYCYQCGQHQKGMDRFFLSLVGESLDNIFSLDSRSARTLFNLFFRPGFLTREYFAGRRARYIQPLRLYLLVSLSFFLLLSVKNFTSDTSIVQLDIADPVVSQTAPASVADSVGDSVADKAPDNAADGKLNTTADHINTSVELPWLSSEANLQLNQRLESQLIKAVELVRADPQQAVATLIDAAPPLLFILLPLFAFLLKLAYIGSSRYYTQHLILAVHNHSFMFLALMAEALASALENWTGGQLLSGVIFAWVPAYLFLSLRKVYGQGYFVTTLKFILLGLCYLGLFIAVFTMGMLANVMTL